ncbi:unnamed protein product, partial [Medioppia subpectinata]
MASKTAVVLGGGISGLSCAYYLQKFCRHLNAFNKIVVLESGSHLGGWLKTCQFGNGVRHELGPRTLRASQNAGYNVLSMVEDIGLADQVIGTSVTSSVTKKRQIVMNNELVTLPNRPLDYLRKPKAFPKRLISYIIKDLKTPKIDLSKYENDCSVYEFFEYRLGKEVADYIFDPLCR